ncbi:CBS domain-containing protein [archaeon]|nr:CBS domain-containing protein [archaeon]
MKLNVLVGDVMTHSVKTVDINDTVDTAAQLMRDERIGSVVVLGDKNVKGVVTTTDIVYKHIAGKKGHRVSDIMSTELVKITPSETIEEAARKMVKHSVEKLLVFDKDKLVGIITNNDIIKVEPAIVEILLEKFKIGVPFPNTDHNVAECESCGNYSDNVEDVNGTYLCSDCRSG